MYGMLVHSCYVEDGQGEKRLVVDEKGSAIATLSIIYPGLY